MLGQAIFNWPKQPLIIITRNTSKINKGMTGLEVKDYIVQVCSLSNS